MANLEYIVAVHNHKKEKAKYYSKQVTYSLALVCFIFFGTIVSYNATETTFNKITGMATYIASSDLANDAEKGTTALTGFVTEVRESPQVTEIKLFFYTIWILIVLAGSAVYYEVKYTSNL